MKKKVLNDPIERTGGNLEKAVVVQGQSCKPMRGRHNYLVFESAPTVTKLPVMAFTTLWANCCFSTCIHFC